MSELLDDLPPKLKSHASWLINAGFEDTRHVLSQMTGSPDEIRMLQAAIATEKKKEARPSRLKPMEAKLRKFTSAPAAVVVDAEIIPDPASMLDGSPNTALSPVQVSALAAVQTAWDDASRLAGLVKNYARAGTAAKALCGLRLRALREHYYGPRNASGGRPKKNDQANTTWAGLLTERLGITDDTATNWIKMAHAVESLADREGLDLRTVCEKLPWDWTAEETALVDSTVRTLTEDKTQRQLLQADFLTDLGYHEPERPNGSNNPTGKNGGKKQPPATPAALLKERQDAARIIFLGTDKPGRIDKGSHAMFMENFINTKGADLEALPQGELRDLYEQTVKPFAAAFRKLAGL